MYKTCLSLYKNVENVNIAVAGSTIRSTAIPSTHFLTSQSLTRLSKLHLSSGYPHLLVTVCGDMCWCIESQYTNATYSSSKLGYIIHITIFSIKKLSIKTSVRKRSDGIIFVRRCKLLWCFLRFQV
jgi:hypothetical protein